MRLKGIVFDLEGTLCDTRALRLEAYRETFKEFAGRTYSDPELAAMLSMSEDDVFRQVFPERHAAAQQVFAKAFKMHHDALAVPAAASKRRWGRSSPMEFAGPWFAPPVNSPP
jgi:phosphoglycolate phosphatase-like HAD superfamily hydrolase